MQKKLLDSFCDTLDRTIEVLGSVRGGRGVWDRTAMVKKQPGKKFGNFLRIRSRGWTGQASGVQGFSGPSLTELDRSIFVSRFPVITAPERDLESSSFFHKNRCHVARWLWRLCVPISSRQGVAPLISLVKILQYVKPFMSFLPEVPEAERKVLCHLTLSSPPDPAPGPIPSESYLHCHHLVVVPRFVPSPSFRHRHL